MKKNNNNNNEKVIFRNYEIRLYLEYKKNEQKKTAIQNIKPVCS